MRRVVILLSILATCTYSTCKKGGIGGCAETSYLFQLGIKAYPDKDSLQLGDTLWLEVNSSTSFWDSISKQIVDYSRAENLGSAIGFGKFVNENSSEDAANLFSFLLVSGTNVQNPFTEKIREYLFIENNNRYIFKLGIVPKYKGVFGLGLSNAANVYRSSDKCTKALFDIHFENTNQHYYLNPNIISSGIDTSLPSGSYNFKVY